MMKRRLGFGCLICQIVWVSFLSAGEPVIINHESVMNFSSIPRYWIEYTKETLHIAYEHTSHGSQLITGMNRLDSFMGTRNIYIFNNGGLKGALDLRDDAMQRYYPQGNASDLGYYPDWVIATRNYLNAVENQKVNVIMWSWCALHASEAEIIGEYLPAMEQLEADYPHVKFVYMTGHSDGGGETGSVHIWNSVIREYCMNNHKILYDFYDIELYDPDGHYYGDKRVNDNCDYDSDNNGSRDSNWAIQWQLSHQENVDWYSCSCSHSQALNCNQKARAAWYLFARLAGWDGCRAVAGDMNGDCRVDLSDYIVLCDGWLSETGGNDWNVVADIVPAEGDGVIDIQDFAQLSLFWMTAHCGQYYSADINGDCSVQWQDWLLLATAWLSQPDLPGWDKRCDIAPAGGDNIVDLQDFSRLAAQWLNK